VGPDGRTGEGLGLLDCVTASTSAPRAIGEVLVEPSREWQGRGLGVLTGFENHGAVTELGPGARPVGEVRLGTGNKDGTVEGAVAGRIWATYLHGPVLARNPRLADLLLSWVVGPLAPLEDSEPDALHAERAARSFGERNRDDHSGTRHSGTRHSGKAHSGKAHGGKWHGGKWHGGKWHGGEGLAGWLRRS
jgi:CobQ-like glutamine amidotransferase family enzyme